VRYIIYIYVVSRLRVKDSGIPGCDTMLLRESLLTFSRIIVPSLTGIKSSQKNAFYMGKIACFFFKTSGTTH
jgi:hypothetical protein